MKSYFLLAAGVLLFSNMNISAGCPGGQCKLQNYGQSGGYQSQGGDNYQGQQGGYNQGQGGYYQGQQGGYNQGQGGYNQNQNQRQGNYYQQGGYYQRQEGNAQPDQDQNQKPRPENSFQGQKQGRFFQQNGYYQRQDQNDSSQPEEEEPNQGSQFRQNRSGNLMIQRDRINDNRTSDNYGNTPTTTQYSQNQASGGDHLIEQKISDTFKPGYFSKGYEGVRADVRNGNVTLSGFVDSDSAKKDVTEKVQKIDGVKGVNNTQLKVQTQTQK